MGWVRIDDNFGHHPKVVKAGPLATTLFIHGLLYCNRYLTDGAIPYEAVPTLVSWQTEELWGFLKDGPVPFPDCYELATRLLEAGLWEDDEVARVYRVHDYSDYQPTRAQMAAKRASLSAIRSESGRKGGVAKAKQTASKAVANAKQNCSPNPNPNPNSSTTPIVPLSGDMSGVANGNTGTRATDQTAIREVFAHWSAKLYPKSEPKFSEDRKRKIRARLSEGFSVEDLKLVVDGALRDDWLMGRKEGSPKNGYRDIKTLYRDSGQVERLIALAPGRPRNDERVAGRPEMPPPAKDAPAGILVPIGPREQKRRPPTDSERALLESIVGKIGTGCGQ